jgi:outer membrane protein OmpA-like peptidoglycan-associated protein
MEKTLLILLILGCTAHGCGPHLFQHESTADREDTNEPSDEPTMEEILAEYRADDFDGDGIPDGEDLCPEDPENFNMMEDDDGCPDGSCPPLGVLDIQIMRKVFFAQGNAILADDDPWLEEVHEVISFILANPWIVRVQVSGHADRLEWNPEKRLALSEDRARTVFDLLVQGGVDASILSVAGYGALCPLKSGNGAKDHDANRRVEFRILEVTEGCSHAKMTCQEAMDEGLVPDMDLRYLPENEYCGTWQD